MLTAMGHIRKSHDQSIQFFFKPHSLPEDIENLDDSIGNSLECPLENVLSLK